MIERKYLAHYVDAAFSSSAPTYVDSARIWKSTTKS